MKKSALLLASLLLATACGRDGGPGSNSAEKSLLETAPAELPSEESAEVRELRKLLTQDRPNVALARFIGDALTREERALLADSMADLDLKSIQVLIDDMVTANRAVRSRYLYHGHAYQNSPTFLYKTISHQGASNDEAFGFKAQLTLGVMSYVRSKTLDRIVETYNNRSKELATDVAPKLAAEIQKKSPEKAREIERLVALNYEPDEVKKKISEAMLQVAMVTEVLGESNLSSGDKGVVFGTGVLAGGIYLLVKENKEFKRIVAKVQEAQETVQELQKKYKEFTVLTTALEQHATSSVQNFRTLRENLSVLKTEIRGLGEETLGSAPGSRGIHSRRIADFIDGSLRGGMPVNLSELPSAYVQRASAINTRLASSVNAIGGLASNLDGIIGTSLKMTKLLGIKLSPEHEKVLRTAQNVASLVSMGSKAYALFQTGGLSAAMGVLGGGSPMGDANSARFDRIDAKLDEVLENQRIMLKLQEQTMEMIKDLAIMVDEYHEREMDQLAVIRNYSIINLEIAKAGVLHKEIASCEQMVRFQLATPWSGSYFDETAYKNWSSIDLFQGLMNKSLVGLAGIRSLVASNGAENYETCKQAMSKAFGEGISRGNPLSYIFESDEEKELLSFSSNFYMPLLSELREQSENLSLRASALHHPMAKLADLELKSSLLPRKGSDSVSASNDEVYGLDQLLSLKNTERYLTSLLLLYPLFEVEKDVWLKDLGTIVNTYLGTRSSGASRSSPALYYLSGALKVVQTAIAQEALLAGEPIIPGVHAKYHNRLLSSSSCGGVKAYAPESRGQDFICFLRSNPQVMHNYLRFALLKSGFGDPAKRSFYEQAYAKKDLGKLAEYVGFDGKVEVDETKLVLKLSVVKSASRTDGVLKLELPTAEELVDTTVLYSEKLRTLFEMQDRLITELEKLHPMRRDLDADSMLKMWGIR